MPAEQLAALRQKAVSARIDQAKFDQQFASSLVPQRAQLLTECLPGAGGFLTAIPSKVLGLAFQPPEFIAELQVRLWMDVYSGDRFCPCCDAVLDAKEVHARSCMAAGDVVACHNCARNLVGRAAASGGFTPTLEKPELLPPARTTPQAPTSGAQPTCTSHPGITVPLLPLIWRLFRLCDRTS